MDVMIKKVLAVIPARGGSKGLKGKNIIDLAGKPLIAWSIEASLNSRYIDETIVSSDSDEILNVAKYFGAKVIKRPSEYATDSSKSEVVLSHALENVAQDYDYVVLLQPTSPLRDTKEIDAAFEKLLSSDATALISVYEIDNKILKAFKEDKKGYIEGVSNNEYPFMPRQNLPKTYMSNGAIYIVSVKEFLDKKSFFTDKTISYLMSDIKSLDIDTKDDLEKVKSYLK
jgi:CMP-N-acetylneuraminic acid synthetase